MSDFLRIVSEPWVGTVLGIVGLGFAIYFYLRARQIVRISYETKETTIVGTPDAAFTAHLKVLFCDVLVPRVTSTQLILWNSGNVTIRRADVAANDPLALVLSGNTAILQATLDKRTRAVNSASVSEGESNNVLKIDFDFLDPGDGFTVTIIHSADVDTVGIRGTVIGLGRGFSRVTGDSMIPRILEALVLMSWAVGVSILINDWTSRNTVLSTVLSIVLSLVVPIIGAIFLMAILDYIPRRFGHKRIPQALSSS